MAPAAHWRLRFLPVTPALLAAALFATSVPLAGVLLAGAGPVTLAALLYLGSGLGLALLMAGRRALTGPAGSDGCITRGDLPWLGAAILAGGVAAPIVLMLSLTVTPAATASLLLNVEAAATAGIAVLLFGEHLGKRAWLALACITGGGALLSITGDGAWSIAPGALGVIFACVLWGLDNNFTCRIAAKDPVPITMVKGVVAGTVSLAIAAAAGESIPALSFVGGGLLLGFFSYGLSIVLYIISLRHIGAARTGAAFATAPFLAVIFAFIIFRDAPGMLFFASIPLMVLGALLLTGELHCHPHTHLPLTHTHHHRHDDLHHDHVHPGGGVDGRSHVHEHTHALTVHTHPHTRDNHHRHVHPEGEEEGDLLRGESTRETE
jgi:drug/metabolite transporter (DMT)-like permease